MTATSSSPERAELARKQASLVRALVGQAPVPAGFDAARVQFYGQSLVEKRIGGVALVWTRLVAAPGKNYAPLFREYAKRFPHPGSCPTTASSRSWASRCARASTGGDSSCRARGSRSAR